jgi:hypothetical protein
VRNKFLLLSVGTIIVLIILTLIVLTDERTKQLKTNRMTTVTYLSEKEIKENKMYDIEYKWGQEWKKGWGRYYKEDKIVNVNVITLGGGVSIVPYDDDIRFIGLCNIKELERKIMEKVK